MLSFAFKPLFPVPQWRLFRLRIRFYCLLVGLLAGFVAAIWIQENQYWWAFGFAAVAIISSLVELVIGDIWAETRYPGSTRTLLERLEINWARVNEHVP